jgi:hypothetical protein
MEYVSEEKAHNSIIKIQLYPSTYLNDGIDFAART